MISFHPTVSPLALSKYIWRTRKPVDLTAVFEEAFPDNLTVLTDSGRSAFAVVIETLNLQGSSMIIPAYVCDALYPVLHTYNIQPYFLDVQKQNYQVPLSSYTDELLAKTDAVVLVATYGRKTDGAIINRLQEHNITIIEDYAARSPLYNDPLSGAARIYSLPKTLPVPDGGLAIVPHGTTITKPASHRTTFAFIKNVLKLLPNVAPLIARIRNWVQSKQPSPSWGGISTASTLTQVILKKYATSIKPPLQSSQYTYCIPLHLHDPELSIKKLRKAGISAERIWKQPIIANADVQKEYCLKTEEFPETLNLASQVVCAPLWHLKDEKSMEHYLTNLKKILTDLL